LLMVNLSINQMEQQIQELVLFMNHLCQLWH
jgi:hypothetical protein